MNQSTFAYLEFDPQLNKLQKKKELRHGISAAVQVGNTVWVANDETLTLERFTVVGNDGGNWRFTDHKQFHLKEFLSLPTPPASGDGVGVQFEEADIEGLDYQDGYLWLVGSHSLKRSKVSKKDAVNERLNKMAEVSVDGNRYLLARIPVVEEDGTYTLKKEVTENGEKRMAAQLKGSDKGNHLTKKLKKDVYLEGSFNVPGKENGFDIEGIVIAENGIFLGMRGPVLRGWAIVLEVVIKKPGKKSPTEFKVKDIRKHFLQLGGLGIRDLCRHGTDLLVLAGPTMDLDGPVTIFRWKNALDQQEHSFVFDKELEVVVDLPYGKEEDHAEGITLFSGTGGEPDSILVVYDSAAANRYVGESSVKADLLPL